jgi:hypothetical protein
VVQRTPEPPESVYDELARILIEEAERDHRRGGRLMSELTFMGDRVRSIIPEDAVFTEVQLLSEGPSQDPDSLLIST